MFKTAFSSFNQQVFFSAGLQSYCDALLELFAGEGLWFNKVF
jgi:hypothetical protein